MNILHTEELTKAYGDTVAVNRVSLHVQESDIYGFLGLNGAGKTTTIRLLLGLIKPDSGSCALFGQKPEQASAIWNDVGYLIETPHAYPNLSVWENLEVICKLRGLPPRPAIGHILERLRLTPYADKKAGHLSLGNKQRLGLAKALIHQPALLILDEPTNGLDPAGIVEVRDLLKGLVNDHGTTIFLSSHNLSEIAKLSTRIGIIHHGALIKELQAWELQALVTKKLQVETPDNPAAMRLLSAHGYEARMDRGPIEVSGPEAIGHPEAIATLLVHHQLPPKLLFVHEEDLEGYFLRVLKE